jgi:hypothetical protein
MFSILASFNLVFDDITTLHLTPAERSDPASTEQVLLVCQNRVAR